LDVPLGLGFVFMFKLCITVSTIQNLFLSK
jgi:hypothetical protein